MKSIHNLVTFLAAVVVLSWAGWQTYLHWDILMAKVAVTPAVFDVPATTDWKAMVCATGEAASAAPCWMVADPVRVRNTS